MKIRVIIIVFVLCVIACSIICLYKWGKQSYVNEFNLAEYQWEIEHFSSERNTGQVNDANTAIEKAKDLWVELFRSESYEPINERKILVFYDSSNQCWLIKGTLASNIDGAVPHALITNAGKVLAVWMG